MTRTNEDFISTFEALSVEMSRLAGRPDSRQFEIEEACARHPGLARYRALLRYIRDVRNALQHPQHRAPGPAFQVSEAFLAETRDLLRRLQDPPTAMKLGVSRAQIRTAAPDERLGDLATEMKRRGFSHLPILDDRGAVIGVFNEAAVFEHLWVGTEAIVSRDMPLSDILEHCRLDAGHTESFHFVDPRTPLEKVVERFVALDTPATRVGALFVTASGKRTETLQRMITPWDVLGVGRD
jgi:CBS domain-containing protein